MTFDRGLLPDALSEPLGYFLLAAVLLLLLAGAGVVVWRRRRHAQGFPLIERARGDSRTDVSREETRLEAVANLSTELIRARDAATAARALLQHVRRLLQVDFAALALVSEDGGEATGLVAYEGDEESAWWRDVRVDLRNEPSAIASAAFEAAPITVYDVEASPRVNRPLAEKVGAKSAAFVPLVAEERVLGVIVAATTTSLRTFRSEELTLVQALAAETALALERTRSAERLAETLARERLVASVARKLRSELDVDAVIRVGLAEVARAMDGVSRAFVRLEDPQFAHARFAGWVAAGVQQIEAEAARLPVVNLAARERKTVAVADVLEAPELEDPELGGVETLTNLGTRAVLAVPIVVVDALIGVFALHAPEPRRWEPAEIALAEAVAQELGLAIRMARLLEENRRRLDQQTALLRAAEVLTGEVRAETVLQRLVVEVTKLLEGDAAHCYLHDPRRGVLRCAAVYGIDPGLLDWEFPAEEGVSGRVLASGRSLIVDDYANADALHDAYGDFRAAIVAPMGWSGETRGVLGVGTRDERRRFGPEDLELIEAFAGLASLALRNVANYEQSVRQARVERGFYRIASALAESLSRTRTLEAIAQAATESLGGASAAVLMPRHGRELELAAAHGLPPRLAAFLEAAAATAADALQAAAGQRRVLAASSLGRDDRFAGDWRDALHEAGFDSLLSIPVEAPRREETGLAVVFFGERQFADDDIDLARHLAAAAKGALERSELFENERRSRAMSQELARTSGLLASELEPHAILEQAVAQAPPLLGVDAAVVSLLEGDDLIVRFTNGAGLEAVAGHRSPVVAGPAADVVQSYGPVAIADAAEVADAAVDPAIAAGYAGYLGAPLLGPEGDVYGVLSLYSRRPRAWPEEEVEAFAALAANTSAFLANAELYQRVALERERSFAILTNVADGIVAVDRAGQIVLWNAAAEEITGIPTVEAVGRTVALVLGRELEAPGGAPRRDRIVSINRGGEEVWLSLTEAVMRDPAGAVAGRIFAFRDISGDRLVEQMKSDFVSTVSQELRRPLTSIYGFAETLLRQDVLFGDEERRTFLGYIASEAQRLSVIVDALLNVARLDAGDLQVDLEPTDVRGVVSEVVASVESQDGHRFVVDVPTESLDAVADREKLRQILAHLIDNAVKFSPGGGTVTIAARRAGRAVEVRVVDEGIGVPAAERDRIFRKFYRHEPEGRDAGSGTGLGLFIAQGLVSAMGGRIWVDAAEPRGSAFAFELPAASQPAAVVE